MQNTDNDIRKAIKYMYRAVKSVFVITVVLSFFFVPSFADTVIFKDGKRAKGLILDEFKDRIILSTAEGEKSIMKSDIRSAIYDSEQKALMKKAKDQFKKGRYIKAYYTYQKVTELNPDLKEAEERLYYLKSYLETKTRDNITSDIRAKKEHSPDAYDMTSSKKVTKELGLVLVPGAKHVFIERVTDKNLVSGQAKPEPGDKIVAVWGEMTAFMDTDEVANMLLAPGEVRFTVERIVTPKLFSYKGLFYKSEFIPLKRFSEFLNRTNFVTGFGKYRHIMGASLKLRRDGLVVDSVIPGGSLEKAGIRKGDLLYRIDGKNTRYMPMSQIIDTIQKNQNRQIELVIRSNITMWRRVSL